VYHSYSAVDDVEPTSTDLIKFSAFKTIKSSINKVILNSFFDDAY